jgi:hypothetical protein
MTMIRMVDWAGVGGLGCQAEIYSPLLRAVDSR